MSNRMTPFCVSKTCTVSGGCFSFRGAEIYDTSRLWNICDPESIVPGKGCGMVLVGSHHVRMRHLMRERVARG